MYGMFVGTWFFAPGSKSASACDATGADMPWYFAPQLPPRLVVLVRRDRAVEHAPAPLVDEQAERQERDLLERELHLRVERALSSLPALAGEADLVQIRRA